ncbi:MAG TPA: hypothetical protein VME24_05765 [Alphaproteobacteria bacterium]|nr:hypothetical protein [Alphaproteobacteria bacterium]
MVKNYAIETAKNPGYVKTKGARREAILSGRQADFQTPEHFFLWMFALGIWNLTCAPLNINIYTYSALVRL